MICQATQDSFTMQTIEKLEAAACEKKQAGDYAGALQDRLALEHLLIDTESYCRAINYNWIAFLSVHTGQLVDAERAARLSLALHSESTLTLDARLATYTFMLACVLATAGNYDEAMIYGDRGIELYHETGHDSEYVSCRQRAVERMNNREPGVYLDRS